MDVLPDVVPGVGWLDDIGYLIAAGFAAKSAVGERKRRTMLEELEFEQMVADKRGAIQTSDENDEKEAA